MKLIIFNCYGVTGTWLTTLYINYVAKNHSWETLYGTKQHDLLYNTHTHIYK